LRITGLCFVVGTKGAGAFERRSLVRGNFGLRDFENSTINLDNQMVKNLSAFSVLLYPEEDQKPKM
jgi:hypothetical protein